VQGLLYLIFSCLARLVQRSQRTVNNLMMSKEHAIKSRFLSESIYWGRFSG